MSEFIPSGEGVGGVRFLSPLWVFVFGSVNGEIVRLCNELLILLLAGD